MLNFTDDTKLKELRAIFEAMEPPSVPPSVTDEPDDGAIDPLAAKQKETDKGIDRRMASNAATTQAEKGEPAYDFQLKIDEITNAINRVNKAIQFRNTQMTPDDPEYPEIMAELNTKLSRLGTELLAAVDQFKTNRSVVSGMPKGKEAGPVTPII